MLCIAGRPLDADMHNLIHEALQEHLLWRKVEESEIPRVEKLMEIIRLYLSDELKFTDLDDAAKILCV